MDCIGWLTTWNFLKTGKKTREVSITEFLHCLSWSESKLMTREWRASLSSEVDSMRKVVLEMG